MWALVLVVVCGGYGLCDSVVLPERYNTQLACEFVGKRAAEKSRVYTFRCVDTDASGAR